MTSLIFGIKQAQTQQQMVIIIVNFIFCLFVISSLPYYKWIIDSFAGKKFIGQAAIVDIPKAIIASVNAMFL